MNFFNFDKKLLELSQIAQKDCEQSFLTIEKIKEHNQEKVLNAFIKSHVKESFFLPSTGYGYGDIGRDAIDRIYADVFGTEDALVRHNFISGTHALTTALFGILRPKDVLLSVTGKPYDTLEEVIGIRGENVGSLKDFGVIYDQIDLKEHFSPDFEEISNRAVKAKVVYIQRSRGYSLRPSLSVDTIKKIAQTAHDANPNTIVMVDNCYGEFVEKIEPTNVGADLIVGSLIKNPGGGLATTGGYIAGKSDLIEQCAYRLTSPGIGKEAGCTLGQNRNILMGLFFAPTVVGEAVKTAIFASRLFELLHFNVTPKYNETRHDIIQAICLNNSENLIAFCQGIQKGSPVDAFVTPEPWDMPGYDSKVIMAAGTFNMGASIELSADAPLREPYAVWMQGGLTYYSGKIGVLMAAQSMLDKGYIQI